jgi:hypothetical protein
MNNLLNILNGGIAMADGKEIVNLAKRHVGESYVLGALAPKDDAAWDGPWDCAEFVSWCVFQVSGKLYGCYDNSCKPALADAYTGYWGRDAQSLGTKISVAQAAGIPGAAVLRLGAKIGHIVISDGEGGTVEAHSSNTGVIADTLSGRDWTMGILVPWINYGAAAAGVPVKKPAVIYRLASPLMQGDKIREIQAQLAAKGYDPQGADGVFGPKTYAAVLSFQRAQGLLADGEVGPRTAQALGISLT